MVLAATLVAPYDLRVEEYPYPTDLEPGAVVLQMLASGICGTDKHTYRGETEQYAGTEHARSTPFPIIQGHENVGVVVEVGPGGAAAFDGTALAIGDRVVPAPNRSCGQCRYCVEDFPYYFCRNLENYGNSLSSSRPPHLFGGWSEYLYVLPRTPMFKVPAELPTDVAVLTELFAVTHSLDLAATMPRPGGFRPGDTVVVMGVGPVGLVHAAKAKLRGARQVIAVDRLAARLDIAAAVGATDCVLATADGETVPSVRTLAPRGVDVVVDATGHPDSFGPALAVLAGRRHAARGRRLRRPRPGTREPGRDTRSQPHRRRGRRRGRPVLRLDVAPARRAPRDRALRSCGHAPLPDRAGGRSDADGAQRRGRDEGHHRPGHGTSHAAAARTGWNAG